MLTSVKNHDFVGLNMLCRRWCLAGPFSGKLAVYASQAKTSEQDIRRQRGQAISAKEWSQALFVQDLVIEAVRSGMQMLPMLHAVPLPGTLSIFTTKENGGKGHAAAQ